MGHILIVPTEPRLEGVFYRGVLKTTRLEESLICLEFSPLPGDRFRIDPALDPPGLGQSVVPVLVDRVGVVGVPGVELFALDDLRVVVPRDRERDPDVLRRLRSDVDALW